MQCFAFGSGGAQTVSLHNIPTLYDRLGHILCKGLLEPNSWLQGPLFCDCYSPYDDISDVMFHDPQSYNIDPPLGVSSEIECTHWRYHLNCKIDVITVIAWVHANPNDFLIATIKINDSDSNKWFWFWTILDKSWFRLVLSSHYSVLITRSQSEMEAGLMKELFLNNI